MAQEVLRVPVPAPPSQVESSRPGSTLIVGAPNAPEEAAADQFADSLLRRLDVSDQPANRPSADARPTPTRIRRAAATLTYERVPTVLPETESRIRRSAASPLDAATADSFSSAAGTDLTRVRVHTDSHAAEAASRIQARAFTINNDIYFGAGQYKPSTDSGKRLLAHEIGHTLQNATAVQRSPVIRRDLWVGTEGRERRADDTDVAALTKWAAANQTPFTLKGGGKFENSQDLAKLVDAGEVYFIEVRGSLSQYLRGRGRNPLEIDPGIRLLPAEPNKGSASTLKVDLTGTPTVVGRPSWDKGIVPDKKKGDHIRHIVPWHVISESFEQWAAGADSALLKQLFSAVGGKDDPKKRAEKGDDTFFAEEILSRVNNSPGNVWAGDASENIVLNQFQSMIGVALLTDLTLDRNAAIEIVKVKTLNTKTSPLYREMCGKLLESLQKSDDDNWRDRAALYQRHGELDVQVEALTKSAGKQSWVLKNIDAYIAAMALFQAGKFPAAAVTLREIPGPG